MRPRVLAFGLSGGETHPGRRASAFLVGAAFRHRHISESLPIMLWKDTSDTRDIDVEILLVSSVPVAHHFV